MWAFNFFSSHSMMSLRTVLDLPNKTAIARSRNQNGVMFLSFQTIERMRRQNAPLLVQCKHLSSATPALNRSVKGQRGKLISTRVFHMRNSETKLNVRIMIYCSATRISTIYCKFHENERHWLVGRQKWPNAFLVIQTMNSRVV